MQRTVLTALVLVGISTSQQARVHSIAVSPNVRVSVDRSHLYHGETWACADPSRRERLALASMAYDPRQAIDRSIVYVSQDAGRSWALARETGESVDPVCAFGADGRLRFLHLARDTNRMEILSSADAGRTWTGPAIAPYLDRPYLVIDQVGKLYINAHEPAASNPRTRVAALLTSEDGRVFTPVRSLEQPAGLTPGNGVLLRDGALLSVFTSARLRPTQMEPAGFVGVIRSSDAGRQFGEAVQVADWYTEAGMSASTMPQIAVDHATDHVYVVWPDTRSGRSEIYVAASTDAGRTWSTPTKVNDDPHPDTRRDHLQPAIAVAPTGVIGVSWFDRREAADNRGWRARFAASFDGGRSFEPNVVVSEQSYDPARSIDQSLNETIEKKPRDGGPSAFRPRWNLRLREGIPPAFPSTLAEHFMPSGSTIGRACSRSGRVRSPSGSSNTSLRDDSSGC